MTQERRKSNRMDIDVRIKLNSVKTKRDTSDLNKDEFEVKLINVSRDGLAFGCTEKLQLNTYYDTTITLWTKEKFETVIEIVRVEKPSADNSDIYGCKFIGILPTDQMKIQIYEMVKNTGN